MLLYAEKRWEKPKKRTYSCFIGHGVERKCIFRSFPNDEKHGSHSSILRNQQICPEFDRKDTFTYNKFVFDFKKMSIFDDPDKVYKRIEVVAGLLYKHLNDCIWRHLGRSNDDISRTTCIIKRGGGKSARNCHLDRVESSITL